MMPRRFSGLTNAQLRDALTRTPEASHLRNELDAVTSSIGRTGQARLTARHWLALAAMVALVMLALFVALIGVRLSRPSGLLALDLGWDILVVREDGSGAQHITQDAETEWAPAWSPDGTRLAYWLEDPLTPADTCGVCSLSSPRRLVVATIAAPSDRRVLTSVSNNTDWAIAWSRDGRQLVVGDLENSVRILVMIDAETGARTRLGPATLDGWDPAWSPDGRYIAFAHGAHDPSTRALEIIDPSGANARRISTIPSRGAGFDTPQWSPIEDVLAFAAETGGPDPFQRDIWTVRLDGAPELDVSTDPADEFGVNWSRDGSQLAWLREDTPGSARYRVVVADASGTNARALPQIVGDSPPTWSPDGTHVLTVELATGDAPARLVSIDARTGTEAVIADAVPVDVGTWQPAQH